MNFLAGSIQKQGVDYFFIHVSGRCRIPLGAAIPGSLEKYIGKSMQIGVRPEHIYICENDSDQGMPDCKLKILAYENMGNEQLVYLSLADQTLIVRRTPRDGLEFGIEKGVRFSPDKLLYIDEITGEVWWKVRVVSAAYWVLGSGYWVLIFQY